MAKGDGARTELDRKKAVRDAIRGTPKVRVRVVRPMQLATMRGDDQVVACTRRGEVVDVPVGGSDSRNSPAYNRWDDIAAMVNAGRLELVEPSVPLTDPEKVTKEHAAKRKKQREERAMGSPGRMFAEMTSLRADLDRKIAELKALQAGAAS